MINWRELEIDMLDLFDTILNEPIDPEEVKQIVQQSIGRRRREAEADAIQMRGEEWQKP
jgi:hypothetical protein